MTLNDIVADCRYKSNMTLAQVSFETRYSQAYICQMESGKRKVSETYWMYWYGKRMISNFSDWNKYENKFEPPIRGIKK